MCVAASACLQTSLQGHEACRSLEEMVNLVSEAVRQEENRLTFSRGCARRVVDLDLNHLFSQGRIASSWEICVLTGT